MPYIFDTETRVDTLVAAINVILASDGQAGLTLRNIGRVSGVSPSSMLGHLGSREHMLRVAAHRTGEGRRDHIADRMRWEGRQRSSLRTAPEVFSPRGRGWRGATSDVRPTGCTPRSIKHAPRSARCWRRPWAPLVGGTWSAAWWRWSTD